MKENIDNDEKMMCTTIADPILESYRIMPSHRLWRVWPPPHFRCGNSHPALMLATYVNSHAFLPGH